MAIDWNYKLPVMHHGRITRNHIQFAYGADLLSPGIAWRLGVGWRREHAHRVWTAGQALLLFIQSRVCPDRGSAYALVERELLEPRIGLGEPTAMVPALSKLDARPSDGGLSVHINTREPWNHYGNSLIESVDKFRGGHKP